MAGDLASNAVIGGPMLIGSAIKINGNVESSLRINGPDCGTIAIGGNVGGPFTVVDPPPTTAIVTFPYAGPQPLMTANAHGLGGSNPTISIATTAAGSFPSTPAVQTINFGGTITGGSFTLSSDGVTTAPIAWNSNPVILAANIQSALTALGTLTVNGPTSGTITIGGTVYGSVQLQGPMQGANLSVGAVAASASVTVQGPVQAAPPPHLGSPAMGSAISVNGNLLGSLTIAGPVDGASTVTVNGNIGATGNNANSVSFGGPLNGSLTVTGSDYSPLVINGPLQGGSINVGGSLANLTINGPMQGGLLQVDGGITANVQINGPVDTNSAVLVGGNIGASTSNAFAVGGPFSGMMVVVGNINSKLSINGPMQGGRIAVNGSILGNLSVNGPIDGASAVAVTGSIGNGHGTVLTAGGIRGIVAAEGAIYAGQVGATNTALFYQGNINTANGQVIANIFATNGASLPLPQTLPAAYADFHAIETNLSKLSVNATTNNLQLSTSNAKAPHNALADAGLAYSPAQIRSAYGLNALSLDGTGQTIAVVDAYDDPSIFESLNTFDQQFGQTDSGPTLYTQYGPSSSFLTVLNETGQALPLPSTDPAGAGSDNWEVEERSTWNGSMPSLPGAQIVLVEANSQSLPDLMSSVGTARQRRACPSYR